MSNAVDATARDVVALDSPLNTEGVGVVQTMGLLEDKQRRLSLAQVRGLQEGWTHCKSISLGFSHSVWWLRLQIRNSSNRPQRLILDLNQPRQDYIHWYVVDHSNGALLLDMESGDRLPFAQRPAMTRSLALPLSLESGTVRDIFVRLDTQDGLYEFIDPTLYDGDEFARREKNAAMYYGLYFGCLLALSLYNLLIWIRSREPCSGWYVFFSTSFMLWSFTYRGFGFEYLWPTSPNFNNQILPIAAAMSFAGFSGFYRHFLLLSTPLPVGYSRAISAFIILNFLAVPLSLADLYAISWMWITPVGLANVAVIVFLVFAMVRRRMRTALLMMVSFLPLGVGAVSTLLQIAGLFPYHREFDAVWEVASAFQMLVLAFGIADSLNQMKMQKLAAEREVHAVQSRLALQLEDQVHERTIELEAANRRLAELSITDGLTGAFNRRYFDQRCADLLTLRNRAPSPIALCMVDIDHFKRFNDRYGHQEGDRVLCAVVAVLKRSLRRKDDAVFRLGGEEFGILFSVDSAELAVAFANELLNSVRELRIRHEGSPLLFVTASFGVDFHSTESIRTITPKQVYSNADEALYAAKSSGRDRVSLFVASSPS